MTPALILVIGAGAALLGVLHALYALYALIQRGLKRIHGSA